MLSQTEEFRPSPDLLIETLEETLKWKKNNEINDSLK